ncbi:heterokaryon incompatibility protein-domain-containing protein, partial [Fusarium redolens]
YSPLGEDEFRVLVLEPGARDDEITCRLCICNHSDRVPYAALSYTWGNPKKVERIRCNGHELGVASNLYGALLQLRDPDRERMLWIDALCINQDDFNERGHQVRNMKTIYSEAREVLVWLGPEDEAVSRVFKSLTSFKPNFYYLLAKTFTRSSLFSGSSSDWQTIGFDFAIAEGHNHLLAADLVSLTKVLERPWFRRLWVLQEVAHAKRVTIVSGKWTIEWELLARLVRYLNHSGLLLDHLSKTAHVGVLAVVEMETARRGTVARKQRSLLSVLLATHSGECSDVRDKIYAVLNLADDYNLDRDIQSFGPDYHLSARDVFTKFARWSIARGNLDILSCTTRSDTPGTEELEGLPSWVPDWTRIDNETPFVRYMNKISFKSGASLQRLAPDEPRVTEDDKLILSGVAVDVVKGVGPRSTFNKSGILEGYSAPVLAANKRWLDSCLRLGYSAHQGMFSNYSCKRSFWRTMTAGLTGQGVQAPPHFGSWFHKYLHLLGWIHQPAMDSSYLRVPDLVITDDDRKRRTQSAAIESAILMWASKRRFAVTEGGRMALVPNTTREGDRIVIV